MQKFTYEKGKLNRSHLKHYADTTFGGTDSPKWAILGKNVDDASVALNPTVESTKNILDETDVNDNGYEPSLEIGTYYANPSDAIYVQLKKIALERLTGEECRTKILEVLIDKTDSPFDAWTEEVYIKRLLSQGTAQREQLHLQAAFLHSQKQNNQKGQKICPFLFWR